VHPNQQLIERLYSCFNARDAIGMGGCYHPEVVFSDPAFGELRGGEVAAMWAMLCSRAQDLAITLAEAAASDERGQARWEARYTFTRTGRAVHNVIDARFLFRDGLIVDHVDHFDFWRWSRQALGLPGLLLGWSPALRSRVRGSARAGLRAFMRGR
jgi:ketosteroid isomerase-like protein